LNVLAHNVRDREIDGDVIALLKQRNVSVIPTLIRDEFLFASGLDRRTVLPEIRAAGAPGT
jgi:hypothetical protein